MPRQFGTIAFTPAVKAMQEKMGSRENYERFVAKGADNNSINPDLEQFISSMQGFYLGTVSSNGYPYIQFRGGKAGFLKFSIGELWDLRIFVAMCNISLWEIWLKMIKHFCS